MKNLKMSIAAILLLTVPFMNAQDGHNHDKMKNGDKKMEQMDHSSMKMGNMNPNAEAVLADYFMLKDALVGDNTKKAAEFASKLGASFKAFDMTAYTAEQQKELVDIIDDATEHAEHIAKSPIDHQREHFKTLSIDITDMVAITGTVHTLYEQFCPMYDNGSVWLSTSKEIKNPYLGSKMVTCGKVQKEIK